MVPTTLPFHPFLALINNLTGSLAFAQLKTAQFNVWSVKTRDRTTHFSFYLALEYWHHLWEPEDLRSKRVSDSPPNEHVPELRSNRVLIGWISFEAARFCLCISCLIIREKQSSERERTVELWETKVPETELRAVHLEKVELEKMKPL